jgi:hypothetical protein
MIREKLKFEGNTQQAAARESIRGRSTTLDGGYLDLLRARDDIVKHPVAAGAFAPSRRVQFLDVAAEWIGLKSVERLHDPAAVLVRKLFE